MSVRCSWAPALILVGLGLIGSAGPAASAEDPGVLCDRLAANPYDPLVAKGAGVRTDRMDAAAAVAACKGAVAADPADARRRYQLGRALDRSGRSEEAMAALQKAAEDGYAVAWNGIGILYEYGSGIAADPAKAAEYYKRAADAGIPVAAANLAGLYARGLGVARDGAKAAELYGKAAEAGDSDSWSFLGTLYQTGDGVPKDQAKALTFYRKASEAGSLHGTGNLGWMYENGFGVAKDETEAARLYRLAADAGVDFAQNNLGVMMKDGRGGLEKDEAEAVRFIRMAADQGLPLAAKNLADFYAEGQGGLGKDQAEAERLYRQAIANGTEGERARAANALAWMFTLAKRNLDEARTLAEASVAEAETSKVDLGDRLDTLAWVLHGLGRDADAQAPIERAVALEPSRATFHDHSGDIYAGLRKADAARVAWRKALEAAASDPSSNIDEAAIRAKLKG